MYIFSKILENFLYLGHHKSLPLNNKKLVLFGPVFPQKFFKSEIMLI